MKAYAARMNGEVRAETVGPTIRAAMVNALYIAERRIVIPNMATDEEIRAYWLKLCGSLDLEIVRVSIITHGPANVETGPIA